MTLCIAGYCRFCALLLLQKFCQENYDCSICNMAGKVKHNQRQTVQKITRQSVIIEHLTLMCETTFRTHRPGRPREINFISRYICFSQIGPFDVCLEVPKYPHFVCFWPLLPTRLNFFGSKWLEKVSPI